VIGEIKKTETILPVEGGISISTDSFLFKKTHEIQTPPFFKSLRGSCNGIRIKDEIWTLCHLVSYEDRRYYYHILVILDYYTYEIKKYTSLFTFEGEKVEYCLGIHYYEESDSLFFGYSVMDKETKYLEIFKSWFDQNMTIL
jgi:hypothetical protein